MDKLFRFAVIIKKNYNLAQNERVLAELDEKAGKMKRSKNVVQQTKCCHASKN